MTKKHAEELNQKLGSNNEHTMRLNKRVRLIQDEIAEIEGGASSEQIKAAPEEVKKATPGPLLGAPEEVKRAQQPIAQPKQQAAEQPEETKVV